MNFRKPNFWKTINIYSLFFLPLTLITLIVNLLKDLIIKQKKFNLPVICVGNIFVGGTGKTPLSIYLFNLLHKNKKNPAIIKKFYSDHIDEILLIKKKISSIFFNKDRSKSIIQAERNKHNVVIMDDGLQDRSIKKNLSIICFNSNEALGNNLLLPAGPLREPLKNKEEYLIVLINGKKNSNLEKKIRFKLKNVKIFYSQYIPKNINKLKNKKLFAFAGIGNPNSFFQLLKDNNLNLKKKVSFPDHYNYSKNEIRTLINDAKKSKLTLVTTEKDFYRLKAFKLPKVNYISVDLIIKNKSSFNNEILKNYD